MSKTSGYAPTPLGSRSSSPPPGTPIMDKDKQAFLMGSPGSKPKVEESSTRDQALPILSYCAASIMMTVVNKVSTRWGQGVWARA